MRPFRKFAALALIAAVSPGCSIRKLAVNKLANALAAGGSTFESDDDPELVAGALPFALKLMESLLAESPRHAGLLLATASGFTEYSYAFVGQPAERAFSENLEESNRLRLRARHLYLRAHSYGMRALEVRYPGFAAALDTDQSAALARIRKPDIALIYWTAAALGLAVSASRDDPEMIAQLPRVEAFIRRAMQLDESWGQGALPEFLINIEAARNDSKPGDIRARIERYYRQALALSGGRRASLFVSYAENSAVPAQNLPLFREMLDRALSIDPNLHVESRLANLMAQRRARWLRERTGELFLTDSPGSPLTGLPGSFGRAAAPEAQCRPAKGSQGEK
jgi:predicted anti-sigma-YlaC factor YlaD